MTATIAESNSAAWESGRTVKTVVAPMRTLDSFQLTQVGFIKIDVEGHEEAVLRGGLATLKREMPNLMIEIEGTPLTWVAPSRFHLFARDRVLRILSQRRGTNADQSI